MHRPVTSQANACTSQAYACMYCMHCPWCHRPMHAVTAWALLFWFFLGYTLISSYFGGKALSLEPNIYSGLANKRHKFWCIEEKIGKTQYIYPFTEVEKLLKVWFCIKYTFTPPTLGYLNTFLRTSYIHIKLIIICFCSYKMPIFVREL
jgi:hypothetical protein